MAWLVGSQDHKSVNQYLNPVSDQSRGAAALLGALKAMKKRGVPMTIERVTRH